MGGGEEVAVGLFRVSALNYERRAGFAVLLQLEM